MDLQYSDVSLEMASYTGKNHFSAFLQKSYYIWELNSAKEGATIVFDLFIHLKIYLNFLGIHEKNIEKKGTI
jgi:hypothetical protein